MVYGVRACKELKLTQACFCGRVGSIQKEKLFTPIVFFVSNCILGMPDTFAIFCLLTFHQTSYHIRVK